MSDRGFRDEEVGLGPESERREGRDEIVSTGGRPMSSATKNRRGAVREARLEEVSPREARVLSLLALALTNKEIASRLGISPATVKRHVENILHKLDLRNRTEAAVYAQSCGLVGLDRKRGP